MGNLFDEPVKAGSSLLGSGRHRRSSTQSVSSTSSGSSATPDSTPTGGKVAGKRRSIFGRMSGIALGLKGGSSRGSMKRGRAMLGRHSAGNITPEGRQEGKALLEKISAQINRAAAQRNAAQPSAAALEAAHVLSRLVTLRTLEKGEALVYQEDPAAFVAFVIKGELRHRAHRPHRRAGRR